jgi:hypothetical protein
MTTPTYVAKKVGDQYVLQRKDPAGVGMDLCWAALGGAAMLAGWKRGGLLGRLASFAGMTLLWRGLTGCRIACSSRHQPASTDVQGPTHQNDARPTGQTPQDAVDEASMESFPGSDAPAHGGAVRAGG